MICLSLPDLPFQTPNNRTSWHAKADHAKTWRTTTSLLARSHRFPEFTGRVKVTLTGWQPDRRRRDPDNLGLLLKACLDGLVDAAVIRDDSLWHVAETACRLEADPEADRWAWQLCVEEVAA